MWKQEGAKTAGMRMMIIAVKPINLGVGVASADSTDTHAHFMVSQNIHTILCLLTLLTLASRILLFGTFSFHVSPFCSTLAIEKGSAGKRRNYDRRHSACDISYATLWSDVSLETASIPA